MTGGAATDMLTWLGYAVLSAAVAASFSGRARQWRLLSCAGAGLFLAKDALSGDWLGVSMQSALLAWLLGSDWWKRRGRKVAKAIGEKSRAALAAVVARAREAGTPLPEGARA